MPSTGYPILDVIVILVVIGLALVFLSRLVGGGFGGRRPR